MDNRAKRSEHESEHSSPSNVKVKMREIFRNNDSLLIKVKPYAVLRSDESQDIKSMKQCPY
jgi:hypothetical protein